MACSLTDVLASACDSGIGKETDPVRLLQVIAQNTADALSGTDITVAAILARACTSGIAKVTDPVKLQQIIAQNLCDAA